MSILDQYFDKWQMSKGTLCGETKKKNEKHYVTNVFKGSKFAMVCRQTTCKRYCNDEALEKLSERMNK